MNSLEDVLAFFRNALDEKSSSVTNHIRLLREQQKSIRLIRQNPKITVNMWISTRRRGDEIWKGIWRTNGHHVSGYAADTTSLNSLIARCAKGFHKKYPQHTQAKFTITLRLWIPEIEIPYSLGKEFEREVNGLTLFYHDSTKTVYA